MRWLTLIALAACRHEAQPTPAPLIAPVPIAAPVVVPVDAASADAAELVTARPPPPVPALPGVRLALDAATGELLAQQIALAWSPDGTRLATRGAPGRIDVWKALAHVSTIEAPRGTFVWWRGAALVGNAFVAGVPRLRSWNGAVVTDERTQLAIDDAAATPSGEIALLAARWRRPKVDEVPMLALDVRGAVTELPIPDAATSSLLAVAIAPDGKRGVAIRVVAEQSSLLLVDVAKRTVMPSEVAADAIAISNSQIAIAQGTSALLLDGTVIAARISPITHLAYAPDGARLAIASRDGTIAIAGGVEWRGDGSEIAAIAWSPDGAQLAIATQTATYLWTAR